MINPIKPSNNTWYPESIAHSLKDLRWYNIFTPYEVEIKNKPIKNPCIKPVCQLNPPALILFNKMAKPKAITNIKRKLVPNIKNMFASLMSSSDNPIALCQLLLNISGLYHTDPRANADNAAITTAKKLISDNSIILKIWLLPFNNYLSRLFANILGDNFNGTRFK